MSTVFLMPRGGAARTPEEQALRDFFGDRLKSLMERANLTQNALAKKASLDRSVVTRLINGENRVNSDQVASLARALSIAPLALWGSEGSSLSPSTNFSTEAAEVAIALDAMPDAIRAAVCDGVLKFLPTIAAAETAKVLLSPNRKSGTSRR